MYYLSTNSRRLAYQYNDFWAKPEDTEGLTYVYASMFKSDRANFLSKNCWHLKLYKTRSSAQAQVTRILNSMVYSLEDLQDFTIDILPLEAYYR